MVSTELALGRNRLTSLLNTRGDQIASAASGYGHSGYGGHGGYGGYTEYICCDTGVDAGTLFALLAGVALATYFLRLQIIILMKGRGFKRSNSNNKNFLDDLMLQFFDSFQQHSETEEWPFKDLIT